MSGRSLKAMISEEWILKKARVTAKRMGDPSEMKQSKMEFQAIKLRFMKQ